MLISVAYQQSDDQRDDPDHDDLRRLAAIQCVALIAHAIEFLTQLVAPFDHTLVRCLQFGNSSLQRLDLRSKCVTLDLARFQGNVELGHLALRRFEAIFVCVDNGVLCIDLFDEFGATPIEFFATWTLCARRARRVCERVRRQ